MTTHSIIPPSSAGIWGKEGGCTAWVTMNQLYPETEQSQESLEGEASHEIGAGLIALAKVGLLNGDNASAWVGKTATNGIVFNEAMHEAASLYAHDVYDVMCKSGVFGGDNLGIEHHIEAPQIHELSQGTLDAFVFDHKKGHLYIWDYKYGFEVVEAFENWQLMNYAAGLLNKLQINGIHDQHLRVHLRVAQPRAYHRDGPIREWVVNASDLRPYFNQMHSNAHKALSDNATENTGNHCKHCPGRHACESSLKAGIQLYEAASAPVPVELSNMALGTQLSLIKRAINHLECLKTGFETQISLKLRSGQNVHGWNLEDTFGRQKWDKSFKEVSTLGDIMGVDLRKQEAVTPNQAIKLGIDEAVIMAYSSKSRTGVRVVPDNINKAKEVFSK